MKETKIICPNCGTSFELPEHEHLCSGVAIGKDSGLGNIFLKEEKRMSRAEQRLEELRKAVYDTSKYMVLKNDQGGEFLFKEDNGTLSPITPKDDIENQIAGSGYIFNRFTNPRWITGQMFQMLRYRGSNGKGYDAALTAKGYDYQFSFVAEELHRLAKMERDNDPMFEMRSQFFTKQVVADLIYSYMADLNVYIDKLKTCKCKGVPYKRIRGLRSNGHNYTDVFVEDISKKVINPLIKYYRNVMFAKTYDRIEEEYKKFLRERYIPLHLNGKYQSKMFRDTYKGLGAYYTCDNLIKFHYCHVYDEFGMLSYERSLRTLNKKTKEYKGEYWRLFSFMKKLIKDNNFEPNWR